MTEIRTGSGRDGLVRAARAGDADAFADLVRAEHRSLVMAARAILGDHHEAEDAAVEAFVAAWRGLSGLAEPGSFGPWLSRILVRTALRRRRRLRRRPAPGDLAEAPAPVPEEDRRLDRLLAEVQRLPAKYRVLLSLHYLRGHSLAETAAATGLPVRRVKSRLFQAREILRRRLDDANDG